MRRFLEKDEMDFTTIMQNRQVTENLAFGEEQKSKVRARKLLQRTIDSYQSNNFPFLAFAIEDKLSMDVRAFAEGMLFQK